MITCTKCGEKNSDDTRFCAKCNNKLQSIRQTVSFENPSGAPLESFRHQNMPPDSWRSLKRMIEAWGYLALLAAVAAGCAFYDTWWPLYPTVALLGLVLWLRRV
ncbi:zinc ribbon domain-containing protein [Pseudodesulfovibrio sp. S3]|uniref:zinc-ribbon domain-containing protein n=1 Tax=Pseudodesulfovibrio sp. S3 TaxID=2283629 RepID=UPI000FEC0C4D|nr:zinc ribbon domain-containing protein [Pseudodesulfovibrio sp. S3]RWU02788.1 zinc ribbon domain-containing protein [Pseudodesulfovibrio sp. S3]